MRAYIYVDGFNLYYRALRKSPYKWLNLELLSKSLIKPEDTVVAVRYFTARVSARGGNNNDPKFQQMYLNALNTVPNIHTHFGRFLSKTKKRPLVSNPNSFVEVSDTEEKGSDVNLASYLLLDAFQDKYDVALVLSQDTDLIEPMRMVRQDLGKLLGLVWLDGRRPDRKMASVASFVRHLSPSNLNNAQFPNSLPRPNGAPSVQKPPNW